MNYELIQYHTTQGIRAAIVVRTGRKYYRLLLLGDTHLRSVPLSEGRYFKNCGAPTPKHLRIFNRVARTFGYSKRKTLL